MSSRRFPGKALADLHGEPMLIRLLERLDLVPGTDVVVATSDDPSDDPIAEVTTTAGRTCYRGSLDDVLARYVGAARVANADPIVRITVDCPLAEPRLIESMLGRLHEARARGDAVDLTSNVRPPTFPDGLDVEIVTRDALERAADECRDPAHREHVLLHLHEHPDRFRHMPVTAANDRSGERWTVDYPADLEFIRAVYAELYPSFGAQFARTPELTSLHAGASRNEGLRPS